MAPTTVNEAGATALASSSTQAQATSDADTGAITPEADVSGGIDPVVDVAAANPAMLTPQMLLPYFTTVLGTNTPSASILVPMTFVPPVPPERLSSRATYVSP